MSAEPPMIDDEDPLPHPQRLLHPLLLPAVVGATIAGALALVAACSAPAPPLDPAVAATTMSFASTPPPGLAPALISGVPHVLQKPDFCGEAATEMFLRHVGVAVDQDAVFGVSGMDPARGMGVTTRELTAALKNLGIDPGPVWHEVKVAQAGADLDALFREMHADLAANVPSIVCTRFDERPDTTEHFRLVLGYDPTEDAVIYSDPAIEKGAYLKMARTRFLGLWPLKYRAESWTVVRLRLKTDKVVAPTPASGFSPAAYAQHVMTLREKLPPSFTVVIEPPFVVVGNGTPKAVKASAEGTVRWATEHLKQDFFKKDPSRILTVYLFADRDSYDTYNRLWFSGAPDTPYGYYSSSRDALVMNIATGGGTLVHEIVHPFIEASFPECPSWFNEGLGSLFEQSAERNDHIIGLTNWRLKGLQQALKRGKIPTFEALMSTGRDDFYNADPGTNYAQSRYLLYYLQEQGLLIRYYNEFYDHRAEDPTGYESLKKILATMGETDMAAFQKKWEAYVLRLTFP